MIKRQIVHVLKLGSPEMKLLGELVKKSKANEKRLIQIESQLKTFKEIIMKSQSDIDKLTEKVQSGSANLSSELQKESAEIQAAIESSKIDTTALEAAIAENQTLTDKVKDMFTAETTPTTGTNPTEPPAPETGTGTPTEEG